MIKKILFSFLIAFGTTSGVLANLTPHNPIVATTSAVVTSSSPEELITSLTLHEPIESDITKVIEEARDNVQKVSLNDPQVMKNFDEIVNSWKTYYLGEKKEKASLQILLEAFTFSAYKHQEEINSGKKSNPNFLHTIRTLQILWNDGNVREVNPQILAILRDIPDSSPNTFEEIEEIFGPSIARLTEEYKDAELEGKQSEEKGHALEMISKASSEVKIVKLAEKINYAQLNPKNNSLALQKFTWNMQLVHALKGANLSLETILEEAYIIQLDSK